MNSYTVRWKLHNYYKDMKKIEQLKDDLKEYRLMDGVGAQVITDMPTSHSISSTVEKIGDKLDYIRELENELDSLMRIKRAIDNVYLYLREPVRTIIEMRYFLFRNPNDIRKCKYNWFEISIEVDRNEDYCRALDCKVVKQIQDKILGGK